MKPVCPNRGLILCLAGAIAGYVVACWADSVAHARSHAVPLQAGAKGRTDDADQDEQLELGRRSFHDNCLMCHADDMTVKLRLTASQWSAEVDKMIGWGASVPPEQKDDMIAYLTATFSRQKPAAPLERITPAQALATIAPLGTAPPGDAGRGRTVYTAHCANCHGSEGRGADLGTNLVERPVLVRPDEFLSVVRAGRRRMAGFEKVVTDSQAADILAWLREQRYIFKTPPKS
jgi:mono/diheme cytochrome c family protein